jgi:hypothetical protein
MKITRYAKKLISLIFAASLAAATFTPSNASAVDDPPTNEYHGPNGSTAVYTCMAPGSGVITFRAPAVPGEVACWFFDIRPASEVGEPRVLQLPLPVITVGARVTVVTWYYIATRGAAERDFGPQVSETVADDIRRVCETQGVGLSSAAAREDWRFRVVCSGASAEEVAARLMLEPAAGTSPELSDVTVVCVYTPSTAHFLQVDAPEVAGTQGTVLSPLPPADE